MKESRILSIAEVAGKTLTEAAIYEVEPQGREILIRFADATQLSIEIGPSFAIDVRYCAEDTPDLPLFHVSTTS